MNVLEYLKIVNFRGFDALEIDGLSKVNLFVGKNNSGKTSVLEAIFLLLGMSNPQLPGTINQIRGMTNPKKQIKYLFHNLSYNNKPAFQGRFSDYTERTLEFEPKFHKKDFSGAFSSVSIPEIGAIELQFTHKERHSAQQPYISSFDLDSGAMALPKNYRELLYAEFIQGKSDGNALSNLSEIVKRKEGDSILKLLQDTFDPGIAGIIPMEDGIYFNMENVGEYIPIHIMGDGIRRFLNIVVAVRRTKQRSYFLIDEIENGLHYSVYKNLWKGLLDFAKQNEVQLFITTHNIETLECLKSVLEEEQYEDVRDDTKVFNVVKTKKSGFQTYKYSFEGFKDAVEHENEIRN